MATTAREKFSSQASPDVLTALRQIAELQGVNSRVHEATHLRPEQANLV